MRIFGLDFSRNSTSTALARIEEKETTPDPTAGGVDINTLMSRLHAFYDTYSGILVTPESCMRAPTVQAIVQAVSRRIATLPVQVYKVSEKKGREFKEKQPSHPVQKLLDQPNNYETSVSYWLDAASYLCRYGRYYAYKARGNTGPIRKLLPLSPRNVETIVTDNYDVSYRCTFPGGGQRDVEFSEMHHVRGPARDGFCGDSPVDDLRESIALEIAAEKFGASFFGNGATPFLVFKYVQGMKGFKTQEEEKQFVQDFQNAYRDQRRFKAMALPAGMEIAETPTMENNKAQFLETRKYQRTVIAGGWGVPPHLVGDLERGTFNNVEQQSLDFIIAVVYPYIKMFEDAMEFDLLTPADRNNGIVIRFNLDAALRGDYKARQEGLAIQRMHGVINANEWRERENTNPIEDDKDGGEAYWVASGVTVAGAEPPPAPVPPGGPKPATDPASPSKPAPAPTK